MEPVTHALAAVAVTRAGLGKATPLATPMAMVAGLAADVDVLSLAGGAESYLSYNRTVTHSLLGGGVLAAAVAAVFWLLGRRSEKHSLRLVPALLISFAAAGAHLLLDLCNSYGAQLLWPFSPKWYAWDLLDTVDPWILIVLVAGLLLPGLFRLVTEEIGAKPVSRGAQRWALATLAVVLLYTALRFFSHGQALERLNAHIYHGASPLKVAAFPRATSPLVWHGVVSTEATLEELEVPVGPVGVFDADRTRTHFKPESSAPLEAAGKTETVQRFVRFARFPVASVERLEQGYRVTLRDLRFPEGPRTGRSVVAVVELDNAARVTLEEFRFSGQN